MPLDSQNNTTERFTFFFSFNKAKQLLTLLLVNLELNDRQPLSDSIGYRDSRKH